jgi:Na+-transporting NADH:ubiquinone oxidoreductase subunit C
MMREKMWYVMGFTFGVTFLIALVLSFAHYQTVDMVRNNELERRQSTVLAALGIEAHTQEEVFAAYSALEHQDLPSTVVGDRPVYVYHDHSGPRFARMFSGPGIWGDITAVISVNADATAVIGVEILDQNETPGLGGRVTSRRFLDQLSGETIGPDGIYVTTRGPGDYSPGNSRIDGITGATGTTRAFDRMLNRELTDLRHILSNNGA